MESQETPLEVAVKWALVRHREGIPGRLRKKPVQQSFEMKKKVNSQEITAKCVLLSSTDHVAWEKKSE